MSTLATMPAMPTQPAGPIRIPSPLYRMTLEQYESLIASGFFTKRDDVHLINGYLVNQMAESPLHSAICEMIRLALQALLLATWHAPQRQAVADSRAIQHAGTRPRDRARRLAGLPGPVSRTGRYRPGRRSVAVEPGRRPGDGRDLRQGGVPIYWIVNLVNGQVEVYSDPGPSGYQSHEVLAPGHVLSVVIDDVEIGEIPVADILP